MSPLADLHAQALQDLEQLLGCPAFEYLGTSYPCVPSTLARGTTIDFGGRLVDIKLTLTVRTCVIKGAGRPLVAGNTLAYQNTEYRIVLVKLSSTGEHTRLDLIDPNR